MAVHLVRAAIPTTTRVNGVTNPAARRRSLPRGSGFRRGTTAAVLRRMRDMTTGAKKTWEAIDAELARSLARRAARRAAADRPSSPLDEVAYDLRWTRTVVGTVAHGGVDDDGMALLVTRSFLWCLHVARELEAIEARELDAGGDWTWFEAFAPNATASFHAALDHLLQALAETADGVAIRGAIDRVLGHFALALRASAWAA